MVSAAVAGLTVLIPSVFTRRTHLPLSITEPPMLYARRMSTRAFLYATSINMFAGIGITAGVSYYCEVDSVQC